MPEVRSTEEARADLEQIRSNGIARFGADPAGHHLRATRQGFELLSAHPLTGQQRPEFRDDTRMISRRPHHILYTVAGDGVLIVRVIHHARDVVAALAGDA